MEIGQTGELGVNVLGRAVEVSPIDTGPAPILRPDMAGDSATAPIRNYCLVDLDHVLVNG